MARRSVSFEVAQLHAIGAFGDLTDTILATLDSSIAAVNVETTLGTIPLEDPFRTSAEPGVGSAATRFLKPKMTLVFRDGTTRSFTPYGDPGPSQGPMLLGIALAVGLAIYGGTKLWKSRRRS